MVIAGRRWYVAATLPKHERLAEDQLKRQSFETILPFIINERGERELRFPSYILVAFDQVDDHWRSINGTRGVRALLFGETPIPLPRGVAETFRTVETFGTLGVSFQIGESVRVTDGPFTGHVGSITRTGRERVQILISLLSRAVPVYVSSSQIDHAA